VDCDDFREALSARLDNEEDADDADQSIEAHLEYCADCAFWYDAAALITRRTRTTAAVAWPDVSDAVLARVPPGRDRVSRAVRLGLGTVGVLQSGVGMATLAVSGYETGAWQLSLGVALGTVAVRRTAPGALVPLLGTLVVVLALGLFSAPHLADVVSALLAAAALTLVLLLGRMPPAHRGPAPPRPLANLLRRTPSTRARPEKNADVTYLTIRLTQSAKSA
jgi:predicted anti-sigma-YlaC factor YlaD